ncbi:hypothetical protein HMSSN036_58100 [Paenibacillus macerans]|nr:hypothetical protein HMSSN036_58100 [Paenibacillus macerans]
MKRKRTVLFMISLMLIAVAGYGVYYFSSIYKGLEGLNKSPENSPFKEVSAKEDTVVEPPQWTGSEPVNILLMGGDGPRDQER